MPEQVSVGGDLGGAETAPTQVSDPLVGRQLGEYRVVRRIGAGAMGIVYLGLQPLIGKQVAIKVLRHEIAGEQAHVQRLLFEAQAVNAIGHRAIVDVIGFGQLEDGRHYIVMEHLSGCSLDALITERGAMTPSEAIPLLDEVVTALAAAHAKGFVHRDLKPSNVFLVSQADGSRYVKLLDFGLVKQLHGPSDTENPSIVGTPAYMAPEQAGGQELGPQADLYSLGVLAFELLTGELPFKSNSIYELIKMHVELRPHAPSTVAGGIPPAMDELVLWLLKKNPADRPPSARTVSAELRQIGRLLRESSTQNAPAPVTSPAVAPAPPPRPSAPAPSSIPVAPSRRGPVAVSLIVLVTCAAVAFGAAQLLRTEERKLLAPLESQAAVSAPLAVLPSPVVEPPPLVQAPLVVDGPPAPVPNPPPGRSRVVKRKPAAVAPLAPGTLEVTPAFGWAEVRVDGKWRCTTPPVCTVEGLSPGTHRLELVGNPKMTPFSKQIVISSGRTLKERVPLTPTAP